MKNEIDMSEEIWICNSCNYEGKRIQFMESESCPKCKKFQSDKFL
jgi:rubrerythrin